MKKGKKQEVKSFTDNWIEELRPAMMTIDKDNRAKEKLLQNGFKI